MEALSASLCGAQFEFLELSQWFGRLVDQEGNLSHAKLGLRRLLLRRKRAGFFEVRAVYRLRAISLGQVREVVLAPARVVH